MAIQHGVAGKSTRNMASKRYEKFYILAAILLLPALLMLTNLNRIAAIGLPGVIVLVLGIKIGADLIEKKALHHKKRAKDADRGAEAEEKVAVQLGSLPDGYHAFHDIGFNGFNIDHVVIGPAGIFLIETKSHRGKVESNGDTLLLNGKLPKKDFLNQTRRQTFNLKKFLWNMTTQHWDVVPVLCFSNAYVQVRKPVKGVNVTRLEYLKDFLAMQPVRLREDEIERLAKQLEYWRSTH